MKLVAVCVGGTKFSQKHIKYISFYFLLFLFVCLVGWLVFFTPPDLNSILNNYGVI